MILLSILMAISYVLWWIVTRNNIDTQPKPVQESECQITWDYKIGSVVYLFWSNGDIEDGELKSVAIDEVWITYFVDVCFDNYTNENYYPNWDCYWYYHSDKIWNTKKELLDRYILEL